MSFIDQTSLKPGTFKTYSISSGHITPVASATDVFTITWGAGVCYIVELGVSYFATSEAGSIFKIIKRSTSGSGGTSSALTPTPVDSGFAAASTTAKSFTANPTVGTAIATLKEFYLNSMVGANRLQTSNNVIWSATKPGESPIILRASGEQLAINLNGVTLNGTAGTLCLNALILETP